MYAWDVVAYGYNADVHCPDCAEQEGMTEPGATDSEGNEPGVVFADNDEWLEGRACGTCGAALREDY